MELRRVSPAELGEMAGLPGMAGDPLDRASIQDYVTDRVEPEIDFDCSMAAAEHGRLSGKPGQEPERNARGRPICLPYLNWIQPCGDRYPSVFLGLF